MLLISRSVLLWMLMTASAGYGALVSDLELSLKTNSDERVVGRVMEYNDDSVVLAIGQAFVSIFWEDVETSSAYRAKKTILTNERGSETSFTAEDHFKLGYFLASRQRSSAAGREFRRAEALDSKYKVQVKDAWRNLRRQREQGRKARGAPMSPASPAAPRVGTVPGGQRGTGQFLHFTEAQHDEAIRAYRAFGVQVRDTISPKLVLLETRHFLIWTDWPESTRNQIPEWVEEMYSMMCKEFGFSSEDPIWLGKCRVLCFKNKARYRKFAMEFDDYDASTTLAYTKTITGGQVQVVLRRLGNKPADIDQFATTLVHEGTHAFLHCYRSERKLPAWLEEGLADYVAEAVIPQRSRTGEASAAAARQIVQSGKSIDELFDFTGSPPAHYYPIAHSLVSYLIDRDHAAFVATIDDFKGGMDFPAALARNYIGLTTKGLDSSWRAHIRKTQLRHPPK
jgi:hypothetical protein